jgi:hypothetical protein
MKHRKRRVPPPPPPAATPLPPARPRRLDPRGSRAEQGKRPLPPPPADLLPFDRDPVLQPAALPGVPQPPENLGDLLRDLTDKYAPPAPPPDALPWFRRPRAKRPEDSRKLVIIPMICARHDRPFVLAFREVRGLFGSGYKLDAIWTDIDGSAGMLPSITVPIAALNWNGITCPHCRAQCRPIHCGICQRLACDGRTTTSGDDILFACAPSCGTVGWVHGTMKTVTGSEGRRSPPPAAANAFICGPATPPGKPQRLPKPR